MVFNTPIDSLNQVELLDQAPHQGNSTALNEVTKKKNQILRRFIDLVCATGGLIVLAPILVLLGLIIILDSRGPVLFRQTRRGLNGVPFLIYKFRTMHVQEDGEFIRQAVAGDERITRVGRVLRKLSLDELPQLLNVITGDMSLVGPRPHALAHDDYYGGCISTYHDRFQVRPGITGWAQINGSRGPTPRLADMERRIELDLWYVQHQTIFLDLSILTRTLRLQLTGRFGAF